MTELTSWRDLDHVADSLLHQERLLRKVLLDLEAEVEASREHWWGNAADAFREHAGRGHRQSHLLRAAELLHHAGRLARDAAKVNRAAMRTNRDGSGGEFG